MTRFLSNALHRSLRVAALGLLAVGPASAQAAEPAKPAANSLPAAAPQSPQVASLENRDYEIVRVRRQNMPEYLPAVGALGAFQTTQIGSQVSGRLDDVLVDVGDVVKKGQPLAKIDTSFISIEVDQRRAELKSAQVRVAQTKLRLDRIAKLFGESGGAMTSEQTLDDARAEYDLAQAQVAQTSLAIRFAEQRLKEATVVAPYDGVITKRLADPGEPIASAPATHILEIQEVNKLELLFPLPQENFGLVKPGSAVHYQVNGLASVFGEAKVDRVYPEVDAATRSFVSRAIVENPDLRLAPGLLVQVGVVCREVANALVLPRSAVFQTAIGESVRVPKGDSYEEKRVVTGVGTLDTIEIKEGLNEGDEVMLLRAPGAGSTSTENAFK